MSTTRPERAESITQVIIVLLIGTMAGAASFTHVHDWTMRKVPAGTGGWFGWANAVISELTPTAAGLDIRRRKRNGRPIAYPMAVLIAAAGLSLSAQVAQAKPSPTGWLLAAVPALAFLALSKLVLSRDDQPATGTTAHARPPGSTSHPEPAPSGLAEPIPPELLTGARMAAFAHRQATGHDITAETLASHLAIPPAIAGTLVHALDGTGTGTGTPPSVIAHANGTGRTGGRP